MADLTSKPAQWEALCAVVLLALLIGSAATVVIVPALSIVGWPSRLAVLAFGGVAATLLAARGLRLGRARERDGVVLAASGLLPKWALSRRLWPRLGLDGGDRRRASWPPATPSGSMDWNFAVAKLGAVAIWLLVLATAMQWAPAHVRLHPAAPFAVCGLVVTLYLGTAGRLPGGPVTLAAATSAADVWVVGDPSFRTLRDWLHRPEGEAAERHRPMASVSTTILQAHTNIARSIPVAPVARPPRRPRGRAASAASARTSSCSSSTACAATTCRRTTPRSPSRRPSTTFAAESTVFTRAFTRYGATGLSVPSIWVGGMVLHKQYVTPFAPMNTLHALLARHELPALDQHGQHRRGDHAARPDRSTRSTSGAASAISACARRSSELRGRLDRLTPGGPPAFAWALPQDIHVAVPQPRGQAARWTAATTTASTRRTPRGCSGSTPASARSSTT